jgi:hypothetical protein
MEHEIKQLIYQNEKLSEENSFLEKEVHLQRSKSEEATHRSK